MNPQSLPRELIGRWRPARTCPELWLAYLRGDDDAMARGLMTWLARSLGPEAMVDELIARGEFEAARLLVQDEHFADGVDAAALDALSTRIDGVAAAAREELDVRLSRIVARVEATGVKLQSEEIRRLAGERLVLAEERLAAAEEAIAVYDRHREQRLLVRLHDVLQPPGLPAAAFEAWREHIRQAILYSALDAAEASLDAGPATDRPPPVQAPLPPLWPYRDEPLSSIIGWFLGTTPAPPSFARYLPPADDPEAAQMVEAVRDWLAEDGEGQRDRLLRTLAGVLRCGLSDLRHVVGGTFARLDDLSAAGFYVFGKRRWPDGIPIWISTFAEPPQDFAKSRILLRIYAEGGGRATSDAVPVLLVDVLALLHDRAERRLRLLHQIGRYVPLSLAFDETTADSSVHWEWSELEPELRNPQHDALVIGAPGIGKSTLLQVLLALHPGSVLLHAPAEVADIPEAPLVLIDNVERLSAREMRGLAMQVHWLGSRGKRQVRLILAGRPESEDALATTAPGMFAVLPLTRRSFESLREQARVMLAWIGVRAEQPVLYDHLAFYAGGNPTLIFYLCGALCRVLHEDGMPRDRLGFQESHLRRAWEDERFRERATALLFNWLHEQPECYAVLRALLDYGSPGAGMTPTDLSWVLGETYGEAPTPTWPGWPAWIEKPLRVLSGHDLVRSDGNAWRIVAGGPALLARYWIQRQPAHSSLDATSLFATLGTRPALAPSGNHP